MNNIFTIFTSPKQFCAFDGLSNSLTIMKDKSVDIGDIVIVRAAHLSGTEWEPTGPIAVRRVVSIKKSETADGEIILTVVRAYRPILFAPRRSLLSRAFKFVRGAWANYV